MFAAEVCVRAECVIPVAEMTVMNGLNRRRTFQGTGAEGREVFTLDWRSSKKKKRNSAKAKAKANEYTSLSEFTGEYVNSQC